MINLKPCPFCGWDADMEYCDPGIDQAPSFYYVQCSNPDCAVKTAKAETSHWALGKGHRNNPNAENEAAETWNTRHSGNA